MPVELAPLQLQGYYVREFIFRIRPGHEEQLRVEMQNGIGLQYVTLFNPDPLTINVQSGVAGHQEDPLRWQCLVQVQSDNPPDRRYPYDFRAVLVGYFRVHEQVPADSRDLVVTVNAPSILYSAARELFASVTGRGPFPHVLLPTVAFTPDAAPTQQPPALEKAEPKGRKKATKRSKKKVASKKRSG